jgi:hypothetical protein
MKVTARFYLLFIDGEQVPKKWSGKDHQSLFPVRKLPLIFVVVFGTRYFVLFLSFCFPCICIVIIYVQDKVNKIEKKGRTII